MPRERRNFEELMAALRTPVYVPNPTDEVEVGRRLMDTWIDLFPTAGAVSRVILLIDSSSIIVVDVSMEWMPDDPLDEKEESGGNRSATARLPAGEDPHDYWYVAFGRAAKLWGMVVTGDRPAGDDDLERLWGDGETDG